jgi:phage-related tail fiber protein
MAGCLATPDECQKSWDLKKEAVQHRDKGEYAAAAQKFQKAAKAHPMEVYQAAYLLNAEGCLVGTWNPAKGYRWNAETGSANKLEAQAILAQVRTLLDAVSTNKCDLKKGQLEALELWYSNALDATNGIFH